MNVLAEVWRLCPRSLFPYRTCSGETNKVTSLTWVILIHSASAIINQIFKECLFADLFQGYRFNFFPAWSGSLAREKKGALFLYCTHAFIQHAYIHALCLSVSVSVSVSVSLCCLLYTSPSPRDISGSRMPSSA